MGINGKTFLFLVLVFIVGGFVASQTNAAVNRALVPKPAPTNTDGL